MSPSTLLARKSSLACSLDEAHDADLVGNKAHNLHRMTRLGLQVPPGMTQSHQFQTAYRSCESLLPPNAPVKGLTPRTALGGQR